MDGRKRMDDEDVSNQLIQLRQRALKQKQMARRQTWIAQLNQELDKRTEYKLQMEGIPRNEIIYWKDKQLLSNISAKWRRKFRHDRTQFLFNEVFPILCKQNHNSSSQISSWRLVSRAWKDAINHVLSPNSEHYHDLFSTDKPNPQSCHKFFSVDEIQRLNRKIEMKKYRGITPFNFHQLYIGHSPINRFRLINAHGSQYWMEMMKLLKHWGNEIWTVIFAVEDGNVELWYEFLIKYLKLMPNLMELVITEVDESLFHEFDFDNLIKERDINVTTPLKLRIKRKPFPELPHLRSLVIQNCMLTPVVEAILAKYGEIEFVSIDGCGYDKYSNEVVDMGEFLAKRQHCFKKCCVMYKNASWISYWGLQFPNLNELSLVYQLVSDDNVQVVENIFKTVNCCGSSVRRLELSIAFNGDHNEWKDRLPAGIKLDLPHLEWLCLMIEKSKITNVDFLLPLVSLKEMTFYYRTMVHLMDNGSGLFSTPDENGKIIQFIGYRDKLYESNIWTLFPEIKRLTVHAIPILDSRNPNVNNATSTVHTRDGYNMQL